jgi:hypothetical protein
MSYFKELPNIKYTANFPNQSFNTDTVNVKNIFRRAKLREDILNAVTAFDYYYIKDGERPDVLAKKFYGDEELDWVILIANNITDINEQWPLNNDTFYKYLIDKYGSEENLQNLKYYESTEVRDEYNRLVLPKGLNVEFAAVKPEPFISKAGVNQYTLSSFILINETQVTVNLNQIVPVTTRVQPNVNHLVTQIFVSPIIRGLSISTLSILNRKSSYTSININNNLTNWAASWGGTLPIRLRDGTDAIFTISDVIGSSSISIPSYLYTINNVNGQPIFSFTPVKP